MKAAEGINAAAALGDNLREHRLEGNIIGQLYYHRREDRTAGMPPLLLRTSAGNQLIQGRSVNFGSFVLTHGGRPQAG